QEISTGAEKRIESEEIFVAAGLKSNADILKVQNTGVKTDSAGWIITNEYLETSAPDIWALGDINGRFQFRHKANYEAEICVHNLFGSEHGHGHKYAVSYRAVPWAIYTHPQIAHLGLTEREVKQHGIPYLVGRNRYSSVAAGFSMGYSNGDDDDGFVKLITDGEWKILGVHIIGPQAAVLLQPFVYLMNAGLSCKPQTLQAKMHDHSRTVGAGGEEAHNHSGSDVHIHEAVVKCRGGGSIIPLFQSMVIHPSLSEVAAWVTGRMEWGE
ncbi:MAG: FAD-dependent oxidoreductase, partial [Thermoplasmata archaeon]